MSQKPEKGDLKKPGTPSQPPKTAPPSSRPTPKPGTSKPTTPPKK